MEAPRLINQPDCEGAQTLFERVRARNRLLYSLFNSRLLLLVLSRRKQNYFLEVKRTTGVFVMKDGEKLFRVTHL